MDGIGNFYTYQPTVGDLYTYWAIESAPLL